MHENSVPFALSQKESKYQNGPQIKLADISPFEKSLLYSVLNT